MTEPLSKPFIEAARPSQAWTPGVLAPSSHRGIPENPRSERYLNSEHIASDDPYGVPEYRERQGLFWNLVAPLLGAPEFVPSIMQPSRVKDDSWRLDAMRRRESRLQALNGAPGSLGAVLEQAAVEVGEAVKAVAKVSKLEQAISWLTEALNAGPQTQKAVEAMARKAGVNPRTLKRAKERLRVQSIRKGRQSWIWALVRAEPDAGQKQ
jgi:hypothetical protein